ncbi:large ribosomal subunit protein bL32m [Cloeon dipterum]|uniref:large ribosomal subunit protein bL32m n=1 Tax=Cloeon dipterum TaxID=197152 RepID=UPI0032209D58
MAVRNAWISLKHCFNSFEEVLSVSLGLRYPYKPTYQAVLLGENNQQTTALAPQNSDPFGLGDGFLWAVPKHRRTIEKRMRRKFGPANLLRIRPRNDLIVCTRCGHHHEIGILCDYCYKKVQEETKLAQDLVQEKLGLSAVDKEVILLYENEAAPQDAQKKFIVEVPKPRPQWFSRNLLQRTTEVETPKAVAETNQVVKPADMG